MKSIKHRLIGIYEKFYEVKRIIVLRTKFRLRIMNPYKTVKYINKNNCSIARYGDGEFNIIMNTRGISFQDVSSELAEALVQTLQNQNSNLLLCVPRCLNTLSYCNKRSKKFFIDWGKDDNHQQRVINLIREHTKKNYRFGDAQITRPYIDWKNDKRAVRLFPMLKELWQGKNIIIVEGEQTRLGVGNDLFYNTKSIKRILAPAINAFDYYQDILNCILDKNNGELVLLALGPTATVLAADLANNNIQALDIGHIDIEYEWFLQGAKEKTAIKGKYTSEVKDGVSFSSCDNKEYISQIIAKIGC